MFSSSVHSSTAVLVKAGSDSIIDDENLKSEQVRSSGTESNFSISSRRLN